MRGDDHCTTVPPEPVQIMNSKLVARKRKQLIPALLLSLFLPVAFFAVSTNSHAETAAVQKFPYKKILDNGPDSERTLFCKLELAKRKSFATRGNNEAQVCKELV